MKTVSFARIMLSLATISAHAAVAETAPPENSSEPAIVLKHGSFAVDGRALSYFCTGNGTPTLILEAPSGLSNREAYQNVLPALAKGYRVCAYERAGYGASPALPEGLVQSLNDYARELDHFLALEAMSKPVVILGYSYGGFVARFYAAHNPEKVKGIVLIDSPHLHWMREMKAQMSLQDWGKVDDILTWFRENRGHDAWISSYEMEAAPKLPEELPVAVITRGQDRELMRQSGISEQGFRIYNDLHQKLAPHLHSLTTQTRAFSADESQHFIPDTEPEIVIDAVETVVAMGA